MGRIRMTNAQAEAFLTSELLGKLINDNKDLPVKDRYWMSVFLRECRKKIEIFIMEKEKIFLQYCDKKDGEPVIEEGPAGNKVYTFSENRDVLVKEVSELASIEIEFPVERFIFTEKIIGNFSAKDMLLISSFADIKIE